MTRPSTSLVLALGLVGCATADPAASATDPTPRPVSSPAPSPATAPTSRPAPASHPDIEGAPASINEGWVQAKPEKAAKTLEKEDREVFAHREEVAAVLGLEPGGRVADIGAGTGFFVKIFADEVGPEGRVYAVDIAPALVEGIRRWAETEQASHVVAVLGTPTDPKLPAGGVDVVFISDTYHHFEDPVATMSRLKAALRPGGRLFVLDFERIPGTSPDWILEHVRAGKEAVIDELTAMGFGFVKEHDIEGLVQNYLIELRAQ